MTSFSKFSLDKAVLNAINELGYTEATPVQSESIPILQNGDDLIAQAQTGTGKTAAFALPILSKIQLDQRVTQALVLAPTRELAIQVAENFTAYAKHLHGIKTVAIYGGQDFRPQLSAIKRGAHIIVATPGRLIDHLERGSLSLNDVQMVVIDEADEMLKMGFIDDVELILSKIKKKHQTALFSATMPPSIVKMTQKYLKDPKRVQIKSEKNSVEKISQFYVSVSRDQKLSALLRFLALEESQGVIVFARTKNDSSVLAEKLQTNGYKAAALNGDMNQAAREKTIERLKNGSLNIVVATDVAARGIDVERITHVFNYEMPFDIDSYVHRIGRTGRAGREGKAILFITPRETRFLKAIENHTNQQIKQLSPPDLSQIQEKKLEGLGKELIAILKNDRIKLDPHIEMIKKISHECKCSGKEIAAALLYLREAKNTFEDNYQEVKPKKHFSEKQRGGRHSFEDRPPRSRNRKPSDDEGQKKHKKFKRREKPSQR